MSSGSNNIVSVESVAFDRIPVGEILPQRPPFVLVDCLLHYDSVRTVCRFEIRPDHLMVEDGRLSACGLIENIAQTCAARIGYIHKYILHLPVALGYIASVRDMNISRLPAVGETIETVVEVREEIFGMTLAGAEIRSGMELLATAEMKIALSDKTVEM